MAIFYPSAYKHIEDTKKHHINKTKKFAKKHQEKKDANGATPVAGAKSKIIHNTSAQAGGGATNPSKTIQKGGNTTNSIQEPKQVETNNLALQSTKEKSVGSLKQAGMNGLY